MLLFTQCLSVFLHTDAFQRFFMPITPCVFEVTRLVVEGLENLNFHDFSPETLPFLSRLHGTLLYGQITRQRWIEGEATASIVNFMLSRFTRQP